MPASSAKLLTGAAALSLLGPAPRLATRVVDGAARRRDRARGGWRRHGRRRTRVDRQRGGTGRHGRPRRGHCGRSRGSRAKGRRRPARRLPLHRRGDQQPLAARGRARRLRRAGDGARGRLRLGDARHAAGARGGCGSGRRPGHRRRAPVRGPARQAGDRHRRQGRARPGAVRRADPGGGRLGTGGRPRRARADGQRQHPRRGARAAGRRPGRPRRHVRGRRRAPCSSASARSASRWPAPQLAGGSGLGDGYRVPARTLTQVLVLAASPEHPELRALLSGLPVAGASGTLADRFNGAHDRQVSAWCAPRPGR